MGQRKITIRWVEGRMWKLIIVWIEFGLVRFVSGEKAIVAHV